MISDKSNSMLPFQSVILPVRNEGKFIASTIDFIRNQDYPADRLEIIVVDGDSDDDTAEIVKCIAADDSRIKLHYNPKRYSSAARNIGVRSSVGEIVTFIDGHTYIDNDQLLKNIARLMEEKKVSVLSRPQFLDTPENTPFQESVSLARKSFLGHGLDSTIYDQRDKYVNPTSSGASYKREVFDKVGYFDEHFDAAEDWDFNLRVHEAGYPAFSSKLLTVYYYPRHNLKSLFYQMRRYGIGRFRIARKHGEYSSSGTGAPFLFVAGLPLLLLLSILFPLISNVLLGVCGLYAVLNLASSIYASAIHGAKHFKYLPFIYLTIHWGLGWGFSLELVKTIFRLHPKKISIPQESRQFKI